tara:strand:+ start:31 stop:567 length:537 start_codon:yes stop_codon:yes gene_type:complete
MGEVMQIIDDYLPQEQFEKIYNKYMSNKVKWEYVNVANPAADKIGMFSFNNMIYDMRFHPPGDKSYLTKCEDLHHLVKNNMAIIRAKANLFTIRDESIKYGWHYDLVQENDIQKPLDNFKTLLYYINNNNGGTDFENDKFVQSKANRAVIVDGNVKHQSVGQTDTNVRLNININYMEI